MARRPILILDTTNVSRIACSPGRTTSPVARSTRRFWRTSAAVIISARPFKVIPHITDEIKNRIRAIEGILRSRCPHHGDTAEPPGDIEGLAVSWRPSGNFLARGWCRQRARDACNARFRSSRPRGRTQDEARPNKASPGCGRSACSRRVIICRTEMPLDAEVRPETVSLLQRSDRGRSSKR